MRSDVLAGLRTLAEDRDADVLEAALLVNVCLDETLDVAAQKNRIGELSTRRPPGVSPWEYLAAEGFGGRQPVDVADGSRLDELLRTRRGLPITLAVLLIDLVRRAGDEAIGINFPGHFLVRVEGVLVDPYSLVTRTETDCLALIPGHLQVEDPFVPATTNTLILRMFNNLKYFYAGRAEFHRALDMVECQLCIEPGDSRLLIESGEFWLRLGSVQSARDAFERALNGIGNSALDPEQRLKLIGMLEQRLEELADRSDTIH